MSKYSELILWTMCGALLPMYYHARPEDWLLFLLAMAFWLSYGFRLGAELFKDVHEKRVKAQFEGRRAEGFAEPPSIHKNGGGLTIHVYPLIEWLVLHNPRAFQGLEFTIKGKAYRLGHVYLNAATVYSDIKEIEKP